MLSVEKNLRMSDKMTAREQKSDKIQENQQNNNN